jgi:hypothetical protein
MSKSKVNTPKFNVGDKVKIVKEVTALTSDFQNVWVTRMSENIGRVVTVRYVNFMGIYFHEISLGYPPASLVKVGFSSFDEVIKYMKCGGYVLAELFKDGPVCYRIKKGILEVNDKELSPEWKKSFYDIYDLQRGRITDISRFTKQKYA